MPTFVEKFRGDFPNGAQVYVNTRQQYATIIDVWEDWREVLYDDETYEWIHITGLKGA